MFCFILFWCCCLIFFLSGWWVFWGVLGLFFFFLLSLFVVFVCLVVGSQPHPLYEKQYNYKISLASNSKLYRVI